jgi:hypothetical protein
MQNRYVMPTPIADALAPTPHTLALRTRAEFSQHLNAGSGDN